MSKNYKRWMLFLQIAAAVVLYLQLRSHEDRTPEDDKLSDQLGSALSYSIEQEREMPPLTKALSMAFHGQDPKLWGNVREAVFGAGNYNYFIREDGTVFSIMKYYYDGNGEPFAFIFPKADGTDDGIQSYYWPEELDDIVILRDLSNKDICIIYYELKGIDDALMICADSYTMYLEKEDGTLWYWNSDRIKYHDNVLALTSPDSCEESRSGEFVRILTEDILETDDEDGTRIVSMCAGEENALFLTEDGHVFASFYETYQVQDVSYYRRSNPAPERLPSILTIEDMELKRLAFQQIPLTDIVSIGIDEEGDFFAIDQNSRNYPVNIAQK